MNLLKNVSSVDLQKKKSGGGMWMTEVGNQWLVMYADQEILPEGPREGFRKSGNPLKLHAKSCFYMSAFFFPWLGVEGRF